MQEFDSRASSRWPVARGLVLAAMASSILWLLVIKAIAAIWLG